MAFIGGQSLTNLSSKRYEKGAGLARYVKVGYMLSSEEDKGRRVARNQSALGQRKFAAVFVAGRRRPICLMTTC